METFILYLLTIQFDLDIDETFFQHKFQIKV